VIIKADSLGSLEGMMNLLKERKILIKRSSIGNITKKDVSDAEANFEKDPLKAVVLGFNVTLPSDVQISPNVKILTNNVIYRLVEELEKWQNEKLKEQEKGILDTLVRPCKLQILRGYVFRQSNPAIVGVEILVGKAKVGSPLMTSDGKELTTIKSMQLDQESINEVEHEKQVAMALEKVTVGRQIKEGDIIYSSLPESHFRKMKELKKYLSKETIELLKEIAEIKRKDNPVWGI
jgi:translation initiation factor 5B